jgi:hypothetical protein
MPADAHAPHVVGDSASQRLDARCVFTPLPECLPSHWRHFAKVPDIARANRTSPIGATRITQDPWSRRYGERFADEIVESSAARENCHGQSAVRETSQPAMAGGSSSTSRQLPGWICRSMITALGGRGTCDPKATLRCKPHISSMGDLVHAGVCAVVMAAGLACTRLRPASTRKRQRPSALPWSRSPVSGRACVSAAALRR